MTFDEWFGRIGKKHLTHPIKETDPEAWITQAMLAAWNASRSERITEEAKEREMEQGELNRGGGYRLAPIREASTIEAKFVAAWQAFNRASGEARERLVIAAIVAAGYDPLPTKGAEWMKHITMEERRGPHGLIFRVKIDGKTFGQVFDGIDPHSYPGDLGTARAGVWTQLASEVKTEGDDDSEHWDDD